MAKTVSCAFCNTELTKGFFGGTAEKIDLADSLSVHCCSACAKKYELSSALHYTRFSDKLANYKYMFKERVSTEKAVEMYLGYLAEYEAHKEKSKGISEACYNGWFFDANKTGHFGVSERRLGFFASDVTRDDKIASFKNDVILDFGFTKDDITCIEYRLTGGDFNGLFRKIYSFEIRLNNEKTVTYKPAVVISAVEGGGFAFGYRHFAEKHAVEYLLDFKKRIGSNLPIKKVSRFR